MFLSELCYLQSINAIHFTYIRRLCALLRNFHYRGDKFSRLHIHLSIIQSFYIDNYFFINLLPSIWISVRIWLWKLKWHPPRQVWHRRASPSFINLWLSCILQYIERSDWCKKLIFSKRILYTGTYSPYQWYGIYK